MEEFEPVAMALCFIGTFVCCIASIISVISVIYKK